ncbi:hypothetical protein Q1695_014940 [Nippostrongylus brasiliensis]|nr:hypothetical protein Q1695_014940 [Nippostrongylus brasiliensis]
MIFQEARRCAAMGFQGFEIGSHVGDKSLDHKDFFPLYKVCEELSLVLFVHPWDMHNWDGRLSKYWMPWLVGSFDAAFSLQHQFRFLQQA